MSPERTMLLIGILLAIGILLTVFGAPITPPPAWLIGWTGWIASVIGFVAALRLIWLGVKAMQFVVRNFEDKTAGREPRVNTEQI